MKILVNALSVRGGGSQTYLINLLQFIPEDRPIDVVLLAPATLDLPVELPLVKRYVAPRFLRNPFARAAWERFWMPVVLKKLDIDILFCPGGIVTSGATYRCKTVTMFRNMIPFDLEQRRKYPFGYQRFRAWLLQKIMLRSMLRADLVVFISEYAKAVIARFAKGRTINSVVIPHGVARQFRAGGVIASPPPGLPSAGYLLYVSSFDVYKSHVQVIQAYALCRSMRCTAEKLLLVGPVNDASYFQQVKFEIERLGLCGEVLLPGPRPPAELAYLYRMAVANIFASESENCPNVLLEALAAGRPVLSSDKPPMPEFGGNAVLYFDPSSPLDLAQKLVALLDDHVCMADLGKRAEARSLLYDCEESARNTWYAIIDLIRSKTAPASPAAPTKYPESR